MHFKLSWIPRNFKTFIIKLKLSILSQNHKNDNQSEFPDFDEFDGRISTYIWFFDFYKKVAIIHMEKSSKVIYGKNIDIENHI